MQYIYCREAKLEFERINKDPIVKEIQQILNNFTWSKKNELAALIRVDFAANEPVT